MASSPTPVPTKPISRKRRFLFRLVAAALSLCCGLLVLEIALRWFPPAQLRIRGSRIALPINQKTVFRNTAIATVDTEIVQTRNSIGFRGADPLPDIVKKLSIVAVGGSTTECYYLSDEKTWPEQLRQRLNRNFRDVWVNNAGLDGHTTFGHEQLLKQYVIALHPQCVLFLIGANDVGLDRPHLNDDKLDKGYWAQGTGQKAYFWIVERSATAALVDNLRRTMQARTAGISHQDINHSQLKWKETQTVSLSAEAVTEILDHHRKTFLPGYRRRVEGLVQLCRESQIFPVLITQPALFGPSKDPQTGVDLARVAVGEVNGDVQWQVLELYNTVTREVARELDTPLIDLASKMPKDSRYFYDFYHFTNAGGVQVAELITEDLVPVLRKEYPQFELAVASSGP